MLADLTITTLASGLDSGQAHMDWDNHTLEQLRATAGPPYTLIARTFLWAQPTWSLGVNQPPADRVTLLAKHPNTPLVYRPTGGRAILHGNDVSFSIITNHPTWLQASIRQTYCWVSAWLKLALTDCGVPLATDCPSTDLGNTSAYTRSPQCFDTTMPSDIKDANGRKLLGTAQLRRQGGLLLQGSAFLQPYGVSVQAFQEAFFKTCILGGLST
jgi:lipoate---protein ligase